MRVTAPATNAAMHGGVSSPARRLRAPALAVLGLVAVAATACSSASARQQPEDQPAEKPQPQEIGRLFASTADGGTLKPVEGTSHVELTLTGVTPQVVWFSDRPARQSGHVSMAEFVESWEGYGFVKDPPNAALAVLGADDGQDTVVVELGSPEFDERQNMVRFPAEVLDEATGNLSHLASDLDHSVQASFGTASLFIDAALGNVINGCNIDANTSCPGADLHQAYLVNAPLPGANLSGANLSGADLIDTDFYTARMASVNFDNAKFCRTMMPDGSTRNDDC